MIAVVSPLVPEAETMGSRDCHELSEIEHNYK